MFDMENPAMMMLAAIGLIALGLAATSAMNGGTQAATVAPDPVAWLVSDEIAGLICPTVPTYHAEHQDRLEAIYQCKARGL